MGIAISGIIATCCCAGAVQQLCICFRQGLSSTSILTNSCLTRAVYAILLTIGVLTACLCLTGHVEKLLLKIPHLCEPYKFIHSINFNINSNGTTNTCESFAGYSGAYRICFAFTIFHMLMAIILYRTRAINDWRNGIQNGFWFFKILLLIGIIITNFLWPISTFNRVLLFIGMIGGFLFIIIQMIFLIDCIYLIIEHWLDKAFDGYKRYTVLLISAFIFFYGLAICITIALFLVYAHSKICMPNQIFIGLNIVFCLIITTVAILPKIQEHNPSLGLVQTAFISFYSTYLVWSSLSSNPAHGIPQCNPSIFSIALLSTDTLRQETIPKDSLNWASIIGLIIFFLMLIYSTISSATIKNSQPHTPLNYNNNAMATPQNKHDDHSSTSIKIPTMVNSDSKENPSSLSSIAIKTDASQISRDGNSKRDNDSSILTNRSTNEQNTVHRLNTIINNNDEELFVDYNYSFFHFVYALASLYAMMTLTNWYQPSQTLTFFNMSTPAYWIKIISSWLCLILFLWSIIAPCLLQNRQF